MSSRFTIFALCGAIVWGYGSFTHGEETIAVTLGGKRLTADSFERRALTAKDAKFGEHAVHAADPIVWLGTHEESATPSAPYLELANGDCLPGRIEEFQAVDRLSGRSDLLLVSPLGNLRAAGGETIEVMFQRTLRYFGAPQPRVHKPGEIALLDGRILRPRSVRMRKYDLAILTESGPLTISWGDIADWWIRDSGRTAAVLQDCFTADSSESNRIMRVQCASGAVVTSGNAYAIEALLAVRRREPSPYLFLQPSWSLREIGFPLSEMTQCSFRERHEIPVSLLDFGALHQDEDSPIVRNGTSNRKRARLGPLTGELSLGMRPDSWLTIPAPPGAKTFSAWTGIDRSVGSGGCATCLVRGSVASDEPLWRGEFLTSETSPIRVPAIDLSGQQNISLASEMAHAGRPAGADPLAIRDETVWLRPMFEIDPTLLAKDSAILGGTAVGAEQWEWQASGEEVRMEFVRPAVRWEPVFVVSPKSEFRLVRKIKLDAQFDALELSLGAIDDPRAYSVELLVDGRKIDPAVSESMDRFVKANWEPLAKRKSFKEVFPPEDHYIYWWDLSSYAGREIELSLRIGTEERRSRWAWRGLKLRSSIEGEQPERAPDLLLWNLADKEFTSPSNRAPALFGKFPGNRGEHILKFGREHAASIGMIRGSSVTVNLAPEYRKLIGAFAVCVEKAGPARITIDDRVVWERELLSLIETAERFEIDLPAGGKKLTLSLGNDGTYLGSVAWIETGFLIGK